MSGHWSIGVCTLALLLLSSLSPASAAAVHHQSAPSAHTVNGTYTGLSLESFNQEAFYGIPFAIPPLGDLRLRYPVPYNQSWRGSRNATVRSDSCPGFDKPFDQGFADGLTMSENCLTLDIVRPANVKPGDDLPVFFWIYGGGFKAGGSADPRYNTSFMVRNSMEMKKPIIAVVPNYRTGAFGLLASKEVAAAGVGNIALFDQRLAMEWVSENIRAFGGDPTKVTIAGESAGGSSAGYHLVAFGGKNNGLFRSAILESSSLLGATMNTVETLNLTYQGWYDNITTTVGCNTAADSLACLRTVPYLKFFNAIDGFQFKPYIDGRFVTQPPSVSIAKGQIADVALIMGSNTDEGTAEFFTPRGTLNNDSDIASLVAHLANGLSDEIVSNVLRLYPDDPIQGCPFGTGPERFADQGVQYKRGAAITGDLNIHAGRRAYAVSHSQRSKHPIYTYRFDQAPWDMKEVDVTTTAPVFVTHYSEIVHVFDNPDKNVNWIGPYPILSELANYVSRAWVSFIHDQNPNNHGLQNKPVWPRYDASKPQNIVFRAGASWIEKDDWRKEQLAYWSTIWSEVMT
ncbi:dipeptidyl peptidase 5 [Trichoderma parareesei]|uniref:Carboxylic ester hydrolase n=1 Tax=Trichoderma parareesei TaxID=858221 RepID=A0A2H2Z8N3_TRIPA|nr:dipeptidyl peptidase 5 [Trichoderma parareesei]